MEIAPIAGIRVMPTIKSRPVDPELTAFFEIVSTARPEEDSYSGNGKKAAAAEEPEEEDHEDPDELADEVQTASSPAASPRTVSLFA